MSCYSLQTTQQKSPGTLAVLIEGKETLCTVNAQQPNAELMQDLSQNSFPDWGIGVVVGGSVAVAGAAIATGILVKKRQLAAQMKKIQH